MARKRATIEQRMEKLRGEIEALVAGPSSSVTRRTLAGKKAALHVMEKVRTRGEEDDYCKGPEPTPEQKQSWGRQHGSEYCKAD